MQPRDTHGRWIRLGRGDLEKVLHAMARQRAENLFEHRSEAKRLAVQRDIRKNALAKHQKAAPVVNVRIRELQNRAVIEVNRPGERVAERHVIPHDKNAGNVKHERVFLPRPVEAHEVDRPDEHMPGVTFEIGEKLRKAIPTVGREAAFDELVAAAQQAAKAMRKAGKKNGALTGPQTELKREVEVARAEGRVPKREADRVVELLEQGIDIEKVANARDRKAVEAVKSKLGVVAPDAEVDEQWLHGDIEDLQPLGGGINTTMKGKIGNRMVLVKPESGLDPRFLRDNIRPGGDMARERSAWLVAQVLEAPSQQVVIRQVPGWGRCIVGHFINDSAKVWMHTPDPDRFARSANGRRIALLDAVLCNMDRHHGNAVVKDGQLYAIDHGLSLPDVPARHFGGNGVLLRAWRNVPLDADELALLRKIDDGLYSKMRSAGLTESAINLMKGRVKYMLSRKRFPDPNRAVNDLNKAVYA